MSKPLLNREQFGPPEHFDDEIRSYKSSARYVPTALEQLLFELAGHRCTVCQAPWLEIHHILELENGGHTEYANLIVLCPNCHTRVHAQSIPTAEELRHYKIRQEIAYQLPVLSRLSAPERELLSELASKSSEEQLSYSKRLHQHVPASTQEEAIESFKREVGFLELRESGMVTVDLEHAITTHALSSVSVALRLHLTGKGVKWLRYLKETNRIPQL